MKAFKSLLLLFVASMITFGATAQAVTTGAKSETKTTATKSTPAKTETKATATKTETKSTVKAETKGTAKPADKGTEPKAAASSPAKRPNGDARTKTGDKINKDKKGPNGETVYTGPKGGDYYLAKDDSKVYLKK